MPKRGRNEEEIANDTMLHNPSVQQTWQPTPFPMPTQPVQYTHQGNNTLAQQQLSFPQHPWSVQQEAIETAEKLKELQTLLVAAPTSVNLLSQLCLISTTTKDFKLLVPQPGFKQVKSEWFRASLHQVVSQGSASFTLANKNLSQMEIHSKAIPGLVMEVLDLILNGEPTDIESMLPGKMEEVIDKAAKCDKFTSEVEESFGYMIELINEVSQASTATRYVAEAKFNEGSCETFEAAAKEAENLSNMKISEANFHDIQKALSSGLTALSSVRKQWTLLAHFFHELARNINMEIFQPLQSFREQLQKQVEKRTRRAPQAISSFAKQKLYTQARQVAKKGFEVNMITATYLHVSRQHLQTPLLSLDQLLTLTSSDIGAAEGLQRTIQLTCEQSQAAIVALIEQNRSEADAKFNEQLQSIESAAKDHGGDDDADIYDDEEEEDEEGDEDAMNTN